MVETSVIEVPVAIALEPLVRRMEGRVPRVAGNSEHWDRQQGVDVKYQAWRGPFAAWMVGHRLVVSAWVNYWVRARKEVLGLVDIDGSCGVNEPPRTVAIGLLSELYWSPNWHLVSRTHVYPSRFQDACRMTVAQLDVTPLLDRVLRARLLRLAHQEVDAEVPRLTWLRPRAEQAWRALQQPIPVDERAWLLLQPEGVWVAPLRGMGATVSTALLLTARPRIVFGDPPTANPRPLPDLRVAYPRGQGLHLVVEAEMPFSEAARRLAEALRGKDEALGTKSLKLGEVRLSGTAGGVTAQLDVSGFVNGTYTLTGRPVYQAQDRTLVLHDLDLSFEPVDVVDRVNEGLIRKRVREALTQHARWSVADRLDRARKRLAAALTRTAAQGASLQAEIREIRPQQVHTTGSAFKIVTVVDGRVQVLVK